MEEFLSELENAGAKNVKIRIRDGLELRDSVRFELNGRIFVIDSGRGPEIIGGSYLRFFVTSTKKS